MFSVIAHPADTADHDMPANLTGATGDPCCVLSTPLGVDAADELAHRLKVLADATRLRLLSIVANSTSGEVCACDLPAAVDRSQPTVSHHLAQLVDAGFLQRAQRGKWAWYRLEPSQLSWVRSALGEGVCPMTTTPNVLFLCVHNAGRSQMAAGYLRHHAGDRVNVYSAGSEPAEAINPVAVEAMAEVGIDITGAQPQRWTDEMAETADVVVSMGCGDECPYFPGQRRLDWELTDPAGEGIELVRAVRDDIAARVEQLVAEIAPTSNC